MLVCHLINGGIIDLCCRTNSSKPRVNVGIRAICHMQEHIHTHKKKQIDTTPLWILKQGWGHMLESYRLLYQEFSTPPSLRYTAYICSVSSWPSGGCQAVPQLYNVSGAVRNLNLGKEAGANIGTDMNFYHSSISSSQYPPPPLFHPPPLKAAPELL